MAGAVYQAVRKSGQRGGKGKAGLTKHHWIKAIKNKTFELEHPGFVRHGPAPRLADDKIINLDTINQIVSKSTEKVTEFDVTQYGYDKVLGKGKLTYKLTVKAPVFSERAQEKISQAGGKAVVLEK